MAALLILSTFADAGTARSVAATLVEERLAACANLVPGVQSIYRWRGEVENASEVLVLFKTTEEARARFEARLKELHPYEVPELLVLRPEGGLPEYLRWIEQSVE